ncbi:hypothetical protein BASA50_009271 [Batrachochytrium salamandrivorans]|uniref:Uncharacterized protein n=1 Tax=Batrachochytrium salamandrivorans TaxID=1357716 RepID=A0ABQ8F279_9FUNG|nr:hypothetical protein BASA50_009271 [Batrachochytrium salamandrivorans]
MRVKVLVAAAMAITSVNAGLSDIICDASNRILGCFGLGNSMSRAESRERLLLDDLSRDPESAKKKLDYGPDGDGKDPLCDPIISKLSDLYDEAVELSSNIPRQRRVSYDPRGYWAKDADRDE